MCAECTPQLLQTSAAASPKTHLSLPARLTGEAGEEGRHEVIDYIFYSPDLGLLKPITIPHMKKEEIGDGKRSAPCWRSPSLSRSADWIHRGTLATAWRLVTVGRDPFSAERGFRDVVQRRWLHPWVFGASRRRAEPPGRIGASSQAPEGSRPLRDRALFYFIFFLSLSLFKSREVNELSG